MKKILYPILLLIFVHMYSYAQQLPSFSHFYANPYVYNPAYVGVNSYNEIFLTHRRQWMGVEGAPVTTDLSLHLPSKGKIAFGLRINNYSRGLLSTTSGIFTIGYTAKLAEDQYLRAGLSGGLGTNAIDFEKVENISDPALANVMNRGMFFDGNAGISYQYKKFTVGISLPKLFQRNVVQTDKFNELQVKRLDHYLFSAGYKFDFSNGNMAFEPQLIYQLAEGMPSQFEALGTLYFYDKFWVGGAYRQDNGPSAFAGVKLNEKLKFGYAYEMSPFQASGFSGGSHELMLNLRFGNKKTKTKKSGLAQIQKNTPAQKKTGSAGEETKPDKLKQAKDAYIEKELSKLPADLSNKKEEVSGVNIEESKRTATMAKPVESFTGEQFNGEVSKKPEEKIVLHKKENPLEMEKGHYVVVSAFRVFDNAVKYHEYLSDTYFESRFGFSSKSLFYYAYILRTTDINKARFERDKLRKMKGFQHTWVLTVE